MPTQPTTQHAEGCDCIGCTPQADALTEAARSGRFPCLAWLIKSAPLEDPPAQPKPFDPLEIFDDDPLE